MRRLIALVVALFTLGAISASAIGSVLPLRGHACCLRAQHKHECHEAEDDDSSGAAEQQETPDIHLHADHSCCENCVSPALITKAASNTRNVIVVVPAAEHSFAQEFYPFAAPEQPIQAQPERAPPAKKPRFAAIQSLIAFVRHHI